jgi:HEAT repeat protein
MRFLTRVLVSCTLLVAAARTADAHGGTYIGPGSTVPPVGGGRGATGGPGGPGVAAGPVTGGPAQDPSSWQTWWWLNRAPYLELKAALARQIVVTHSDSAGSGSSAAQDDASRKSEVRRLRTRMVSVLSEALAQSHAPDVTTAILLALGKAGSCLPEADVPRVQDAIRPLLQDTNQEIAETAAIALGAIAQPAPALLLVEILEDSDIGRKLVGRPEVPYRTRAFAAYGLGLIGRRVPSQDVRRYVVRHLSRALEMDHTASDDLGVACLEALGIVRVDMPAASASKSATASTDATLDVQTASLLQTFGRQKRSDVLRAYVPVSLARAVSTKPPELVDDAVATLCAVLEPHAKEPTLVQQSAAMALASLTPASEAQQKRIFATLHENVSQGERLVSNLSLLSLARITATSVPNSAGVDPASQARALFEREMLRGFTGARPWAALALGISEYMRLRAGFDPSNDARAAIRTALSDRRGPNEIGAYCVAAGLMRDPGSRDLMLHVLLDTADDDLRANAAIGLGLLHDDAAIEPLHKVLTESRFRPVLLRDSAIALGLLGDVHAAIATALGFIGDARSIEPLLGLVESKTSGERTKAFAAAALGNICDESPLPWNTPYSLDVNYVLPPATLYEPIGAAGLLDML